MIYDDGQGRLFSGIDLETTPANTYIGDIIYEHGIGIVNEYYWKNQIIGSQSFDARWKSSVPIFTTNVVCKIKDSEYNFTLNPSAIDTNGNLKDNVSGSEFNPYITTVGLYNDSHELLGVAKLSKPIPKSPDTDMTFIIKFDM